MDRQTTEEMPPLRNSHQMARRQLMVRAPPKKLRETTHAQEPVARATDRLKKSRSVEAATIKTQNYYVVRL